MVLTSSLPLLAASSGTWPDSQLAPVLIAVIVLAVIGTTVLFVLGVVAYSRRRTLQYLLVTVALGVLVTRSIFGLGTVFGLVPMTFHHLVEHGLDFFIAVLVLYAVYRSGPASRSDDREPSSLESDRDSE